MKLQKLNYGSKYCGHQSSISHLLVESIGIKITCLFFTPSLWGRGTGIVVFLFIWLSIEWQAWRGRWCGVFLHFRGDIDRMRWYGDTFTPSKLHLIRHDFFAFKQKQQQRKIEKGFTENCFSNYNNYWNTSLFQLVHVDFKDKESRTNK